MGKLFTSSLPVSFGLHGIQIEVHPSLLHRHIPDEDELLPSFGPEIGISTLSILLAKSLKNNRAFTTATADSVKLSKYLLVRIVRRWTKMRIVIQNARQSGYRLNAT